MKRENKGHVVRGQEKTLNPVVVHLNPGTLGPLNPLFKYNSDAPELIASLPHLFQVGLDH